MQFRTSDLPKSALPSAVRIVSVVIFIAFFGCSQDKNDVNLLIGRWDVVNATRNNKATSTLSDAYFEFVNDTLMMTNILRRDLEFPYVLEDDAIRQLGTPPITYKIVESFADSLVLSSQISNYQFQFFLRRSFQQDTIAM